MILEFKTFIKDPNPWKEGKAAAGLGRGKQLNCLCRLLERLRERTQQDKPQSKWCCPARVSTFRLSLSCWLQATSGGVWPWSRQLQQVLSWGGVWAVECHSTAIAWDRKYDDDKKNDFTFADIIRDPWRNESHNLMIILAHWKWNWRVFTIAYS